MTKVVLFTPGAEARRTLATQRLARDKEIAKVREPIDFTSLRRAFALRATGSFSSHVIDSCRIPSPRGDLLFDLSIDPQHDVVWFTRRALNVLNKTLGLEMVGLQIQTNNNVSEIVGMSRARLSQGKERTLSAAELTTFDRVSFKDAQIRLKYIKKTGNHSDNAEVKIIVAQLTSLLGHYYSI